MINLPNAKINLGLNVLHKREDGYHAIESVFYPVMWQDILEVIENTGSAGDEFSYSGIPIPGNEEENLCRKAVALLRKSSTFPALKVHLHKQIPMGAGLGGGSADAGFLLRLINDFAGCKLSNSKLEELALQLGSDCPFFIRNVPQSVTGRGEKMKELNVDLSAYKILVVYPGLHISTAGAYSGISPFVPQKSCEEIVMQHPVSEWKLVLKNDFESVAFAKFPELKKLKQLLYDTGAIYASMTGSGSSFYGIYSEIPGADSLQKFSKYTFKIC